MFCSHSYCGLINIWAVLASSVVFFALGALWYSPVLFSKAWLEESKVIPDKSKGMAKIMVSSFLLTVFMVHALALLIGITGAFSPLAGLKFGLLTGAGFVAAGIGINYLFEGKTIKFFLINAGYQMTGLLISGLIIGWWGR